MFFGNAIHRRLSEWGNMAAMRPPLHLLPAELVHVPSAQRTWFGGAHESNAEQSAMVATHCSLPSGPQ